MDINSFIRPFANICDYLKALKIIQERFSVKTKNYDEITYAICSTINGQFTLPSITNFIDSVVMFPKNSGIEFFRTLPTNKDTMYRRVLTPNIELCIICPNEIKLIIGKVKLLKEPMLYKNDGIG